VDEIKVSRAGNCPDCDSKTVRLYPPDKRLSNLPSYCDTCEILWIDGERVEPVEEFKNQFKAVDECAKAAAGTIKEELLANPEERIQQYFERVFNWAFSEGFVRSYMYVRFKMKEGRMVRIRELWEKGKVDHYTGKFSGLSVEELRELDRLITWAKRK